MTGIAITKKVDMIRTISTSSAPAAIGPYSQATIAHGFIFVSGQLPIRPGAAELCSDDIAEQTHQCLCNIDEILLDAGSSMRDILKTTVLVTDLAKFDAVNAVYATFFDGAAPPARATYEVARLPKDAQIEIEAVGLCRRT
ncbi:Rid family detoxifying hydrolase [Mycobacterium sp. NPDC003323]